MSANNDDPGGCLAGAFYLMWLAVAVIIILNFHARISCLERGKACPDISISETLK